MHSFSEHPSGGISLLSTHLVPDRDRLLQGLLPRVLPRREDPRFFRLPFLDLDLLFFTRIEEGNGMFSFYTLTRDVLWEYELQEDELMAHAKENARHRLHCMSLAAALQQDLASEEHPLYVLSTGDQFYGAGPALFCTEPLRDLAETLGTDRLFLLPSSIHEILALPAMEDHRDEMNATIRMINRTQVLEAERLSDHLYVYSRETDTISW